MAFEFKLPDLGEGLTEGEIARWLVREGAEVHEDDPLVEIQTDKATVEIPSPYEGTVLRILVAEGEVAPVGAALVLIGAAGDDVPETDTSRDTSRGQTLGPVPKGQGAGSARISATPLVRRMARELGVDLTSVAGTGPGGRITDDDVRTAASSLGTDTSDALTPLIPAEGRRVPLRGVRRVIAEHMARAQREVPAVTWVEECAFDHVDLERLVATVVKACADALQEFPELNARLEENEIVLLDRYDIGVAVQTEQGLLVPVVRGCDAKSVEEIDAEVRRLAEAAREGSLAAEDLRGSTFTVTSAGKVAGLFQTPIVNHPEVAILSVGRIGLRPVVRDGEIVVRQMGHVALTFDHRVVDGARAAEFGLAVISRLESGKMA
jgi:pyruvate/2-oxoglutarate dehydrogenase complex dihydrolipoamide acyltransferase (E2) component